MKDIHAFEPIWEDWVIDDEIGHGSFGTVWRAHHEDRFSHVRQYAAVKHISIPKQDGPGDDDIVFPSDEVRATYYRNMLNRLVAEIDAMISLRGKPNIVFCEEHKVVPKEQNSGYDLFLRMELLKSVPKYLSENKKRFPDHDETLRLGIDIATALEILESRNFVHRDIKPDNIFTDEEGNYKLGDFGTARVLEATGNASTITGTPNYMAPEVYSRSGRYDQTVDIYSLGIVLYRYLNNGSLPLMTDPTVFADDALTRRIRGEKLPNPCNADEELSAVILKACAFRPEDRYQKAKDLKRDLVRCLERPAREVEIPVVCRTDDGREIYRGIKKAKAGSRVKIGMEDIPYERLMGEGKDLVSAREFIVAVDAAGKMNPPEAGFTWSDSRTLFSVSVEVICLDENHHELLRQRTECYYQNRNVVNAPAIEGYRPAGRTEAEVEVLGNRSTKPPQVVFEYRKERAEASTPAAAPAECDVPVLCVLENGKVILNSQRTCRENSANIVPAPDITGYVLTGSGSEKVHVSHDGKATPDKVVFTYRTVKKEIVPAKVSVICRDDFGKEIQRDSVEGKANETLNIKAPEIKGYKLVNTDNKAVEITVDENGIPSRNEVVFVYEAAKGNKRIFALIGIAASLLLIAAGIWIFTRPAKNYEVIWKNYNGDILEQDHKVTSGTIPEYNGTVPAREDADGYSYEFIGWSPDIEEVKGDISYTARYKSTLTEDRLTGRETVTPEADVTETPVPYYTITWLTGSETETTTVAAGEMPAHDDPVKEPDEKYTYTFTGWTPEVKKAESDAVYQAIFSPEVISYTITWVNEDGKELEQDLKVTSGTMPEYNSSIPAKADDDRYSYSFSGWTPNVEPAREDITYTAKYDREERNTDTPVPDVTPVPQYTITWSTGSGTETTTVAAGEMPKHADPVKEPDEQYTYTFTGWIPEVKEAAADAAYIAEFREDPRSYTITWKDETGKTIDTTIVEHGSKPSHASLTKDATEQYTYTFTGWTPELKVATENITYTATFREEKRTYKITWLNFKGEAFDTTTVAYGDMPMHAKLTKAPDIQYSYSFTGWDPEIRPVTGDATYKAVFKQKIRSYKITWKDDTGKTIDTTTVAYGTKPSHEGLTKEATEQYTYTFAGWEPEITAVTGDATYTAMFNKETTVSVEVGDIVSFGRYEQDNNSENGREAIEWIVLDVDTENSKALLLSRYGLHNKPYNIKSTSITWEKCTLRDWLNNEFLKSAFSTEEQDAIQTTLVDNSASQGYSGWNIDSGNDTRDKIFLLSYAEANRHFGVDFGVSNIKSRVAPTAFAIAQGASVDKSFKTDDGNAAGWWWLRSSSPLRIGAANVNVDGQLSYSYVFFEFLAIRPALWVDLKSGMPLTKDAIDTTASKQETDSFTITWKDDAGKIIDTTTVAYGTKPNHEDLTKDATEQYTYTFTGWTPELKEATENVTYTAIFREEKRTYKITWLNFKGEAFDTTTVAYGDMPMHAKLIKAPDIQYSYSFTGWDPEIRPVTGDATYKAVFKQKIRSYKITWKDEAGKTIDTTTVRYGEKPSHIDPTKEATKKYTYSFTGWQPTIQRVTGDATYTAVFKQKIRSYKITWKDDTGKTIDTTTVKYGEKPTHDDLTKASTKKYTYTFAGWKPKIKEVTEDATYTAVFNKKKKTVQAGDIISFGRYEQDNNTKNGREAIEWIVLDVDKKNKKALLLSRYGLRNKPYNDTYADVTWGKCTLRNWLNDKFLNSVFTEKEQAAILTTKVDNSASQGYSSWNTKGGNDTKDKIFLLSYAEANQYLGVTYENDNIKARVAPTAYAIAQGAWAISGYKTADGELAGWWWLRSPGRSQDGAARVRDGGSLSDAHVNGDYYVVRPALWINLESDLF